MMPALQKQKSFWGFPADGYKCLVSLLAPQSCALRDFHPIPTYSFWAFKPLWDHSRTSSRASGASSGHVWALYGSIIWGISGLSFGAWLGHYLGHVWGIIWGMSGECLISTVLHASLMPFCFKTSVKTKWWKILAFHKVGQRVLI